MGSRVIYLFQTFLFTQDVWKIKRHKRKGNARVGLQKERADYIVWDFYLPCSSCIMTVAVLSTDYEPGRKYFISHIFCVFLSGFLLGSHWRASFHNQHLFYVPYYWSIPWEAHNNFFPVLFLKTMGCFFFFTKCTVQNQTIFKHDRKSTKWPNLAKQGSDC